jgi:hypothetical protein
MPAVKFQVDAGLKVLAVRPHTFRVHSDNAMIDSGSGFYVECFDRLNLSHKSIPVHTGREGGGDWTVPPDVDAEERDRQLDAAFFAAESIMAEAHKWYENAHFITHGCTVEVVKGRKAPKGRYEVTLHAQGNYGPYVNLRDAAGKRYNYISVGNVKVVPNLADEFIKSAAFRKLGNEFLSFVTTVAEHGFTETAWGIFADWVEQTDAVVSSGGYTAEDLALMIRRAAARRKNSTPSLYAAECHNEFRRMFAGV